MGTLSANSAHAISQQKVCSAKKIDPEQAEQLLKENVLSYQADGFIQLPLQKRRAKKDYLYGQIKSQDLNALANVLQEHSIPFRSLIIDMSDNKNPDLKQLTDVLKCLSELTRLKLTTLDFRKSKISDQGAQEIANALKTHKSLKNLNLISTVLEQNGVKHIAEALKENKSLVTLHLEGTNIGKAGAKHIAETLKENKSLKYYARNFNLVYFKLRN